MHVLGPTFLWWFGLTAVGIAGLPYVRMLLPDLPDGGLGVARPLGLLLVAFTWWWAVTLGILPNNGLGAWLAAGGVAGVGAKLIWSQRREAWAALQARRRRLVGQEILFAVALLAWALYRAFYPDVTQAGGEKTMELAFLSAILQSPRFPPNDPWMAGESISYYYFSYVMGALLTRLSGIERAVAFNLLVPGTLAMTLVAAFSIGANLVALSRRATRRMAWLVGAASAGGLALLGSIQGALEVGYRAGVPSRAFYQWLSVFDIGGNQAWANGALAPETPGACGKQDAVYNELARIVDANPGIQLGVLDMVPNRFIWWWRASRVIRDGCTEAIHEFPFFSFMLADAHPHVLSLPFMLLAITLALALLAGAATRWPGGPGMHAVWWLVPLVVGGIAFLNTWDLLTYALLVLVAYALATWRAVPRPLEVGLAALPARVSVAALALAAGWMGAGPTARRVRTFLSEIPDDQAVATLPHVLVAAAIGSGLWLLSERVRRLARTNPQAARGWDVLRFTAWLALASWLLYVPFHLAFASQAEGIATADFSSRPAQWFVHWAWQYVWLLGLMGAALWSAPRRTALLRALGLAALAITLPALSWPLQLSRGGVIVLAAASVSLAVWWPIRPWTAGLSAVVAGFLRSAAIVGATSIALWRIASPPPMPPGDAMGGAAGWTPWTPLLIAIPLIAAVAAGLQRWPWPTTASVDSKADGVATTGSAGLDASSSVDGTQAIADDQSEYTTDSTLHSIPGPSTPGSSTSSVALHAEAPVSADGPGIGWPHEPEVAARDTPAQPAAGVESAPLASSAPAVEIGMVFALLCASVGLMMVLGAEFFYVRDIFNSRMNTIFKFYIQGWTLLSLAGGYGLFAGWRRLPRPVAAAWMGTVGIVTAMALIYPLAAIWDRTGGFQWPVLQGEGVRAWADRLSLDGLRYWEQSYPGDRAAAQWLSDNVSGAPHILEATGGGYSHTGRIAMVTGLPTVLGADGHEQQWRGTRVQIDPRKADVEAFYGGRMNEEEMGAMLDRYDVRYVVLGEWERAQHNVPETVSLRLARWGRTVFSQSGVTIYQRR